MTHYQFELSKDDESEVRLRLLDYDAQVIGEYLMTESTPGEGFTQIDQQPSTVSDMLKEIGINLSYWNLNKIFQPIGETGYFIKIQEDWSDNEKRLHKFYLINTKKKCVDCILISKHGWSVVLD